MTRFVPALMLVAPLFGAGACDRQTSPESEAAGSVPASVPSPLTARGRLSEVDPATSTLVVTTARVDGEERLIFRYDSQTQIVGAQGESQGLAGLGGSLVVVRYAERGMTRHALRIEVSPAAPALPTP